jgi:SAM-dependent methyltransferase
VRLLPLGISYRRALLDGELGRLAPRFAGRVLEVGAKRLPRGRFRAPAVPGRRWTRLDLDVRERPDVVADVQQLPIRDGAVDWVLCLEVLEYVPSPDRALAEIGRVLGPAGSAVVAVPFMHPADAAADRYRFTETRLRELAEQAGLRVLEVLRQGAFFTTLANMCRQANARVPSRLVRLALAAGVVPLTAALVALDRFPAVRRSAFLSSFTTGFLVVATKRTPGGSFDSGSGPGGARPPGAPIPGSPVHRGAPS